ncbi:hypothetical protein [Nostoc parmelioides]|uniref:Uncharacterized protein n=1 Tax=Nostoc parmelioides FACHB-3921 TaxID=2692909 RepID=A0ABR8B7Z7_9NOSO|nr:hypothetical protein [Nostoc parmelioides]MBD2250070.1 hypothetical protein [Nostoc parmelioides FACHB-3921]
MEIKTEKFLHLIDQALKIAEQMRTELAHSERLNNVITVLQSLRNQALAGQLEPSTGTSTLGLAREVADWVEPLDSPLLKAVGAIEAFYQNNL